MVWMYVTQKSHSIWMTGIISSLILWDQEFLFLGPSNDNEYVQISDDVLDKLIVVGKTMREVMHMIAPD